VPEPGVVDQEVHLAALVEQRQRRDRVGQVARDRPHLHPVAFLQLAGDHGQPLAASGHQHEVMAIAGEQPRQLQSDPP
jgi:hypothetical protein